VRVFRDRADAGQQLARALEQYRSENPLILAIPRGGAEVAYQVAKHLEADLGLLMVRKLPYPDNPESGFGAIAEDGSTYLNQEAALTLSERAIYGIIRQQNIEIDRRVEVLRQGRPLPEIEGRIVILIDDGIAMGSTMRAAISLCRRRKASSLVVAVPVAGRRVANEMQRLADRVIVLEQPRYFRAVAQVYRSWRDVPDDEVIEVMDRWQKDRAREKAL
jgi:predicted phosphoribosyltransferase